MDIKSVDNSINRDNTAKPVAAADAQKKSGQPSSGDSQSIDTVTLTDAVAQLIELQDSLAQIPDVRNERVEAIRQALSEGLYEVDTDKLAENLTKTELE